MNLDVIFTDKERTYGDHIVRILTFQAGCILASKPHRPKMLYSAGKFLGGMANIMAVCVKHGSDIRYMYRV